jgi:hypothetical protein
MAKIHEALNIKYEEVWWMKKNLSNG